jgi:hypothetical protein
MIDTGSAAFPSPNRPERQADPALAVDAGLETVCPLELDALYHADGSCIPEAAIAGLAEQLGLPRTVAYALPIAWQDEPHGGCWLFPETDGGGRRVGTSCRYRDGTTGLLPGGRRGLSEPDEWNNGVLPLLLPVGVTDTLAATALGLSALGRPGDLEALDDLADRLRIVPSDRPLIAFARGNGRGGSPAVAQDAARRAAAELGARLGRPVAWALPPDGAHDLRAWAVEQFGRAAGRLHWLDLGRIFLDRLRPQSAPAAVAQGMTAAELFRRELPPARWVVEGLLPQGVTILAGKPKGGKSWLALQLAVAAAGGGSLPGAGAVAAGEVLYLALEDTEVRLRDRLGRMLAGDASAAPTRLSLATTWRPLAEGGRDDLVAWLGTHPDARLVVIDTLAMLRGRRRGAAAPDDCRTVEVMRSLAARFGIAVLIVHHVRKKAAVDAFDAVLGKVEVTATSDGLWVLARARQEREAVLHVTGRDVGEQELALSWDADRGLWSFLGPAEELRLSREQARALELLARAGRPLTPRELAPLLEKPQGATRVLLWRMAEKGLVVSEAGAYALTQRGEAARERRSQDAAGPGS